MCIILKFIEWFAVFFVALEVLFYNGFSYITFAIQVRYFPLNSTPPTIRAVIFSYPMRLKTDFADCQINHQGLPNKEEPGNIPTCSVYMLGEPWSVDSAALVEECGDSPVWSWQAWVAQTDWGITIFNFFAVDTINRAKNQLDTPFITSSVDWKLTFVIYVRLVFSDMRFSHWDFTEWKIALWFCLKVYLLMPLKWMHIRNINKNIFQILTLEILALAPRNSGMNLNKNLAKLLYRHQGATLSNALNKKNYS